MEKKGSIRQGSKNLTAQYAVINGFLWMAYVPVLGFTSVYLLDNGFSNTRIGMISAVAAISSVIMQPFFASKADRPENPSLVYYLTALSCLLTAITGSLLFPGKPTVLTGLLFGSAMAFLPVLTPLVNSLGTESMNQGKKLNYGVARGVGSATYGVASAVLGVLTAKYGAGCVPFTAMLIFVCFVFSVRIFPFQKTVHGEKRENAVKTGNFIGFFLRYKCFTMVLAGCIMLHICHAVLNNFIFQIVRSKGGGSSEMGTAMIISAFSELPVMFLFHFMVKKIRCNTWLKISGVFYALKALGTLLVPNIYGFYAIQLLQMFSWALTCVSSVAYVNLVMEPEDTIKGQAYMTATFSIGSVIASFVAGRLFDVATADAALILATAAGTAGMVVLMIFCRKPSKENF